MTQTATVAAVPGPGVARVTVARQSACCHDCASCGGCGATPGAITVLAETDLDLTPGDRVELFLNGKSLGAEPVERFTARFKTTYQPGVLEAVSYRNGAELSRDRLETAGEPVRLVLRPESTEARADGESLLFVLVEFQDAQGRRVPGVRLPLSARVEGAASLLSFASANPLTDENYESGQAASFDGRAMAILRAGHTPGKAVLTLSCPGMEDAKQELFLS